MTYDVNAVAYVLNIGIVFYIGIVFILALFYADAKLLFTCEHWLVQYMLFSLYYIARLSLKYSIAIINIGAAVN